ncbi:WxL domain-containing protein [Enterococcus faecalis]|nr:WxL domain-containing protein [Enterococcus faecalis]
MVYEEAFEFPEETFQFGFVNQDGQLVKSDDITIAYDYSRYLTNNGTNTWNGIDLNQKAITDGKLKKITMPKSSMPLHVGEAQAIGEAMINISFSLPKYYTGLNIYNKSGKIDSNYPLPPRHYYTNNQEVIGLVTDDVFSDWLTLAKAADNSYVYKNALASPEPVNSSFPMMRRGVTGYTYYYSLDAPVYYHLTQRKVTENFVDATGAKITPPTGFTQGKQTGIDSDPYTFKQAGTLPDTYKAGTKTYKFKGWYKGKTKPNTLTTTKAPSYAVTYDDNDDLNVVYEEIEAFDFPALTYQFGFVDESGKRVDASTIGLTYDKWRGELLTNNVNDWKTVSLEKGQVAPTKNNLKEIAYPAQSLEIMSGRSSQYSAANLTFTPPRYYEKMSVYNKSGTFDAGYPFPNIQNNNSSEPSVEGLNKNLSSWFELKKRGNQSFVFNKPIPAAPIDVQVPAYLREIVYNPDLISNTAVYYVIDKPVYYYLTNRKVTENFVDTSGAKITAPTGFTQGKQTVINSDPYTFKQSGTLPDTYQADGKTYKFKGWYKGKGIPNTLTTTKAPSYAVTYDDNDDLNVVYEEETVTTLYPSINMNFVNEKGGAFTPALTFSGKYYAQSTSASLRTDLYDVTSKNNGSGQYTVSINNGSMPLSQELLKKYNNGQPISVTNRLRFNVDKLTIDQQLKYVDGIQVDTAQSSSLNYYGHKYTSGSSMIFDPNIAPTEYNMTTEQINSLNFSSDGTYFSNANNRFFNMHLGYNSSGGSLLLMMALFNENPVNQPKLVYKVTRKQVTENFVDTNGAKITAPTGFTQGNKIPMTSNTFKYTAAKALPASYTTGGKTYIFQGWYKGKTKPNTLTTSTTPTYNTTFDGNDDMTAMYKEEVPKASVALTRTTAETVTSGGNVTWRATITNTSQAPLTTATIKKSTAWTTGLAAPTAMIVTPAGGTAKTVPVTATTWTNGVSLGTDIPVGKSATVQFTTKATGTAGQVLRAGITTSGNYSGVSTSATVRVKDNDQAIVTPTAEGFISVPTFNFGQVGVAGSTQQHGLKKAADYYGNGTRNPYLRIKKTQPNWSLTAQLSQPKSATDSLPTATRLLLGAAPVSSFSNYNQPTELKNAVGTTSAISLNANNTATRIIANQQFTGSNIYQLDFTFNNVKLEVPANQGVKGQQYQAAVTWNLVTGP